MSPLRDVTGTDGHPPLEFPPDIELDEAARNWVHLHREHARPMRQVAADAAVTSAIGSAYGPA